MRIALIGLVTLWAASAAAQSSGVGAAAWLAGCWVMELGQRSTLEMWMPPAGGMMLGASRTVVNGVTREYERLILREVQGQLVYVADPSGQVETSFLATAVTDSSFTVENPDHDFPQRITYRRIGADSLVALVEGGGRAFEQRMRRASCRVSEPARR